MLVEIDNELKLSREYNPDTTLEIRDGYFIFTVRRNEFPKEYLKKAELQDYVLDDVQNIEGRFVASWKKRITAPAINQIPKSEKPKNRREYGTLVKVPIDKCVVCGQPGRLFEPYPKTFKVYHKGNATCSISRKLDELGVSREDVHKFILYKAKKIEIEHSGTSGTVGAAIAEKLEEEPKEVIDVRHLLEKEK